MRVEVRSIVESVVSLAVPGIWQARLSMTSSSSVLHGPSVPELGSAAGGGKFTRLTTRCSAAMCLIRSASA